MVRQALKATILSIFSVIVAVCGLSPVHAIDAAVTSSQSVPTLHVNRKPTVPALFQIGFMSGLEPGKSEISIAGSHGVEIVSPTLWGMPWWQDGVEPSFDGNDVDMWMDAVLAANPNALILPRFPVDQPATWWIDQHPDEMTLFHDGTRGIASVHSTIWRTDAANQIGKLIRLLETRYGDHIIGYHVCGQYSAEWFYDGFWEGKHAGFEPPALEGFKTFLRAKYVTDAALGTAWNNPSITFDTVQVPSVAERTSVGYGDFRNPVSQQKAIDFDDYQNVDMADTVSLMCKAVKDVTPNKLTIAFYGYHLELNGSSRSGHLALSRLLSSPYVDAVCAPYSYVDRQPGGDGRLMGPVDSAMSNGKLWFTEDDTRTHLAEPGALGRCADLRETNGVLTRNFSHVLTRGGALWWMDGAGVGWFNSDAIWQNNEKLTGAYRAGMPYFTGYSPEIVIIVDERSCLYSNPSWSVTLPLLSNFRSQCYRIGAPVGIYLLDDLVAGKVPPARMYIVLNAFRLDQPQIDAIRSQACGEGRTVIWMYAPGLVRDGVISPSYVSDVVGINLAQTSTGDGNLSLTGGGTFSAEHAHLSPTFRVSDGSTQTIATYSNGGQVAVASKNMPQGYTSVYCGTLQLPTSVLRTLATQVGVHVYSDQNDIVAAGNGYVSVYATSAGTKSLHMPYECTLIDTLTGEQMGPASAFSFDMLMGDAKLLRIPPYSDTHAAVSWEFNTNGNNEGWLPEHSVANLTSTGGCLTLDVNGPDPFIHGPRYPNINADMNRQVYMRMKVSLGSNAEIFWGNLAEPWHVQARAVSFPITADNQFHDYIVDMSSNPNWSGLVNIPRLDPTDASSGHVEIDFIRVGDFNAPAGSVSINSGSQYCPDRTVLLSLSATDAASGVDQMRFADAGLTWSNWEDYAASKDWTLPSGDGAKSVFVQFKDRAGNISGTCTDSIILDTTAPTGSISVNVGAAYANSSAVALTLSGLDAGSGVAEMRLTNAGSLWQAWEPYSAERTWTLTAGNGNRTVFVQFKDLFGNTSSTYADSIVVDATAPSVPGVPTDAGAYTGDTSVTFDWAAAADTGGSGISGYDCRIGTAPGAGDVFDGSVGNTLNKTVTGVFGGRYFCSVQAVDNAGNSGAWSAGSDGISVVEHSGISIGTTKVLADANSVGLAGKSVAAIFGDCIYVEELDRSSGIRIVPVGGIPQQIAVGALINIGGTLRTNANRERWIEATVAVVTRLSGQYPVVKIRRL